ncbi:MAG TPA: thioredoxin family protein, partial [Rectinemataceae bacterium]|nr:thioredoxin family protein [Rectinemataceae bacterium]
NRVDAGAVAITIAYAAGTAIPLLGIMVGGRGLLSRLPGLARRMAAIQRGFGAVMLVMALVIAMQWDRRIQAAILEAFPSYGSGLTAFEDNPAVRKAIDAREGAASGAVRDGGGAAATSSSYSASALFAGSSELSSKGLRVDLGLAPPLVAAGPWFNTEGPGKGPSRPLTQKDLRGKVLLIDFWTYSCINCIRTLPWLRAWNAAYADKGLVIIGVHSPEFAFERVPSNLQKAIADLGVTWPVVMDNDLAEWRAWSNRYWPAHYLVDARGRVRAWRFGEGDYAATEAEIRALLAEAGTRAGPSLSPPRALLAARTPETYLGYERARGFASAVVPVADKATNYLPARSPGVGEWNLGGVWTIKGSYLESGGMDSLSLGFDARDVYLVVEAGDGGGRIGVSVDGMATADTEDVKAGVLVPRESRAYHLVGGQAPGLHVLKLEVSGSLRLYAFTFG